MENTIKRKARMCYTLKPSEKDLFHLIGEISVTGMSSLNEIGFIAMASITNKTAVQMYTQLMLMVDFRSSGKHF